MGDSKLNDVKVPGFLKFIKKKGPKGCLIFLISIIGLTMGLIYVIRFYSKELMVILPESTLLIVLAISGIFYGISQAATRWFGLVDVKNEQGTFHLSSPYWNDLLRSISMMVFSIFGIIATHYWENGFFAYFFTVVLIAVIWKAVTRIRKDRNDGIIISDDFLSIDVEDSDEKRVFKKEEISLIQMENLGTTTRPEKRIVVYYKNKIENEGDLKFGFDPNELNIGRRVVFKYLEEKKYPIQRRSIGWQILNS